VQEDSQIVCANRFSNLAAEVSQNLVKRSIHSVLRNLRRRLGVTADTAHVQEDSQIVCADRFSNLAAEVSQNLVKRSIHSVLRNLKRRL